MGQTGPVAATFDVDAVGDGARTDGDGVVVVVLTVGDSTGVVALVLPVGDEEVAADCGFAVVVVRLPGVCGDRPALGEQAVTPRPKTAVARIIRVKRPRELLMIVPLRCIGKSWVDPPEITVSPCNTAWKAPKVRCSPTSPRSATTGPGRRAPRGKGGRVVSP
jgi:hypothetical protein